MSGFLGFLLVLAVSPDVTTGYEAAILCSGFPTPAWEVRVASTPSLQARSVQPIHLPRLCGGGTGSSDYELVPMSCCTRGWLELPLTPHIQSRPRRRAGHQLGPPGWGRRGPDAILMETQYPEVACAASSRVKLRGGGERLPFPVNPATCLCSQGVVGPGRGSLGGEAGQVLPRPPGPPHLHPGHVFLLPGPGVTSAQ